MASIKVRHLVAKVQGATTRWYWQPSAALRAQGWRPERLPQDRAAAMAAAEARNAEVDAWRQGTGAAPATAPGGAPARQAAPAHGTLAYVVQDYRRHRTFLALKPNSRVEYAKYLDRLVLWAGPQPIARLVPQAWEALYVEHLARAPAAANMLLRVGRVAWLHARYLMLVSDADHPGPGAVRLQGTPPRVVVWTFAAEAAAVAAADRAGWPQLGDAIVLLAGTGQRPGDACRFTRLQAQAGRFRIAQEKTGARVEVQLATPQVQARTRAILARHQAAGHAAPQLLLSPDGRPLTADRLGVLWWELRQRLQDQAPGQTAGQAAELQRLQLRDLRDTAVTRLASAGCTLAEICAITGHSLASAKQVLKHYLAATDDQAAAAMAKLVSWEAGARRPAEGGS